MLRVTTSWDDGDILDKRLANLLSRYGIKGTFYITKNYRPKRLEDEGIKVLAQSHEIGAHTLTHPDLRSNTVEIKESKNWLEQILGSQVKMFCYPKGLYNEAVVRAVKDAGFLGARTTRLASLTIEDPFLMPVTIQVYPLHWRSYKQRSPGWKALGISIFSMYSWLSIAKAAFNIAIKEGGVFHLYGHAWEIEKYDMWDDLEKFLQYISHHKDCVYLTNSETLE